MFLGYEAPGEIWTKLLTKSLNFRLGCKMTKNLLSATLLVDNKFQNSL